MNPRYRISIELAVYINIIRSITSHSFLKQTSAGRHENTADGTRKLVIQSDWKEVAVLFFLEWISSNKNSCRFLAYFKLWLLLLLKSLGVITLDMNQLLKPKTAI
jgi:hypothetical protein